MQEALKLTLREIRKRNPVAHTHYHSRSSQDYLIQQIIDLAGLHHQKIQKIRTWEESAKYLRLALTRLVSGKMLFS